MKQEAVSNLRNLKDPRSKRIPFTLQFEPSVFFFIYQPSPTTESTVWEAKLERHSPFIVSLLSRPCPEEDAR